MTTYSVGEEIPQREEFLGENLKREGERKNHRKKSAKRASEKGKENVPLSNKASESFMM
jgi:hypothetical protein